ncbi:homocysteine S-methyltransferase [Streptomyces sp. HNM0574]|uniref:homocysteine S-methyltransferase n=1 Tax=Streptomyces sp. HNM0574 TaxID=2714954 RepID=UPI00146EBE1D|nr:homocysteine S-methyltransferase [Streptomyces sp. HNM0574]
MSAAPPLAAALAEGPVVLDGGLSNQLEAQGCDLSDPLWSARLLADAPERIRAAHTAYVAAGARVLITGSYQASFEGFARRGVGRAEAAALFRRSVELARAAGESGAAGGEPVRVAASVGPYGAVLADGSEYRGRYGLSVRELERFHRPRVEALAEAGPDVLALETVPDADEVEALLRAAGGCGVPVWLSCTVAAGRTRAGQPLAAAFAPAAGNAQVIAVGVNCCAAHEVGDAVEEAVAVTGRPAVAYPNSGEGWDAAARGWRGAPTFAPERSPAAVRDWADRGARLIGGCCRVGPEQIRGVARALRA